MDQFLESFDCPVCGAYMYGIEVHCDVDASLKAMAEKVERAERLRKEAEARTDEELERQIESMKQAIRLDHIALDNLRQQLRNTEEAMVYWREKAGHGS